MAGRDRDKFSLGLFYLGYSSDLKAALRPRISLGDEYGGEIFYNFAITPWLRLAVDRQVLHPPRKNRDTAVVGGLRAQVLF